MHTLLKFYADWCGPCTAMQPVMDQLKTDMAETVIVANINIDDNPQSRLDYHVRSIPCYVLLEDGKEISRKTGSATLSEMKEWINESGSVQPDVL